MATRASASAESLALFPDLERFRHARAGTLSGGQKQMLSIARALVNPEPAPLIDEPSKVSPRSSSSTRRTRSGR